MPIDSIQSYSSQAVSQPQGIAMGQSAERVNASLSPDLVKQVSERVYAMLLNDLKAERERLGSRSGRISLARRG